MANFTISLLSDTPVISNELQNYLPTVQGTDPLVGFNGANIGQGAGNGLDELVAFSFLFPQLDSVQSAQLTLELQSFGTSTDELLFQDNASIRGANSKFYGNDVLSAIPSGSTQFVTFDLANIDTTQGSENLLNLLLDGDLNIVYADDAIIKQAQLTVDATISTLTVDTLVDEDDGDLSPGDVSLREALKHISNNGIINFDPAILNPGATIELLDSLVINKSLEIRGPGADRLAIAGQLGIIGETYGFQTVIVNGSGDTVTIDGLTITGGAQGIRQSNPDGSLVVSNSTISGNGLILDQQGNPAGYGASLGGGIGNYAGSLRLVNSTVSGNRADTGGGIRSQGITEIINSTIADNRVFFAGGGFQIAGPTTIINSTISGNRGGSSNSGGIRSGGRYGGGPLTIINSTISGNEGAGIHIFGDNLVLRNSTVTANDTGLQLGNFTTATVSNSIVAGNGTDLVSFSITPFISDGHNLIGNGSGISGFVNGVNGDQVGNSMNPIDPLLGSLADNGGPTLTHTLLAGSPAINAGNAALRPLDTFDLDGDSNTSELLPVDQRGLSRVVGPLDIGAVELQSSGEESEQEPTPPPPDDDEANDHETNDHLVATHDILIGIYDAQTDTLIAAIEDGDELLASTLASVDITIAAFIFPNGSLEQVESVILNLNEGQVTRTENIEPYALFGDLGGDFKGGGLGLLSEGNHAIALDLYSGNHGTGELLATITRTFTVSDL